MSFFLIDIFFLILDYYKMSDHICLYFMENGSKEQWLLSCLGKDNNDFTSLIKGCHCKIKDTSGMKIFRYIYNALKVIILIIVFSITHKLFG